MASLMYGITSGTLKKIEIPNYLIFRVLTLQCEDRRISRPAIDVRGNFC